jgi:hypothetical protein
MKEYNRDVGKYGKRLDTVSDTFSNILGIISTERVEQEEAGGYLPMIMNDAVKGDEGIAESITSASETLNTLHGDVRRSIGEIQIDISNVKIDTIPEFGSALNDYKTAKESNDVAKQQYTQQTQNHVIAFTTNIAIFAGAVGVVYMAVNGR